MITKEVYVEIEVLRKHGFRLRKIAAEVGCAVNTVRSHLAQGSQPRYQRQKKRATKLSAHEAYLGDRQASAQPQWIPATVLFREISALGYVGGISQLRAFLRTIRPQVAADRSFVSRPRQANSYKSTGSSFAKALIRYTPSAPPSGTAGRVMWNSSPT